MLDLLLTIALDTFQQGLQALLMLLTQLLHLAHKCLLKILVHHVRFMHLLILDHVSHSVRLIIVFNREEYFLLFAHFDQIFAVALLYEESFGHLLFMKHKLLLLLDLELLNKLKSSGLVLAHVLIPSIGEFGELQLLSALNIDQLLFLSQAHVLFLPLLFSPSKLLEPQLHHLRPSVVTLGLSIDAQLVHNSQESEYLIIGQEINSSLGKECTIPLLVQLIHLDGSGARPLTRPSTTT